MTRYGLLLSIGVIILDQATKYWIVHYVMVPPRIIEVTTFFNIVMVWNKGVSFGLFSSQSLWTQALLGCVAIIICTFLFAWLRNTKSIWLATALGLVIGGALGNVIDRGIYYSVADFLDFHVFEYHWPSFNVADMAISLGIIILILDGFFGNNRKNKFKG